MYHNINYYYVIVFFLFTDAFPKMPVYWGQLVYFATTEQSCWGALVSVTQNLRIS